MFTLYPPSLCPIEYPTRVLRLCLARLSPLLELKTQTNLANGSGVSGGGGKRGKKRARGQEDSLIGSLEGRQSRPMSGNIVDIILAFLKSKSTIITSLISSHPSFTSYAITRPVPRGIFYPPTSFITSSSPQYPLFRIFISFTSCSTPGSCWECVGAGIVHDRR